MEREEGSREREEGRREREEGRRERGEGRREREEGKRERERRGEGRAGPCPPPLGYMASMAITSNYM